MACLPVRLGREFHGCPVSALLGFTANDCLDIGTDLGSCVSLDYFDDASFKLNGTIDGMQAQYANE